MAWVEKTKTGWRVVERVKVGGEIRRFSVPMNDDTSESRKDATNMLRERIGKAVKDPKTAIFPHFIYYITDNERNSIKIGFSKNPVARFQHLQISNCDRLELIQTIEFPNRQMARTAESFLHKTFRAQVSSSMSEWFDSSIVNELRKSYWTADQIIEMQEEEKWKEKSGGMC